MTVVTVLAAMPSEPSRRLADASQELVTGSFRASRRSASSSPRLRWRRSRRETREERCDGRAKARGLSGVMPNRLHPWRVALGGERQYGRRQWEALNRRILLKNSIFRINHNSEDRWRPR